MREKRLANGRLPVTSSQGEIMPQNTVKPVQKAVQKSKSKSVAKTCPEKSAGDSKKKAPGRAEASTAARIGYARVSSDDQELHLQMDALSAAGCSVIYQEKASGRRADRAELANCLKALRPGDSLVVWRLDRLGRSLADLVATVTSLEERRVALESLTEKIDTSSSTGKLVFHLFAALAEFERNLIRERTVAGLAAARQRGRRGGRKPKLDAQQIREIKALLADPAITIKDVAKRYCVARSTLYSHLK